VALRTSSVKLVVFVVVLGTSEAPGKVLHEMARGLATAGGWVWPSLALALWAATDARLAAHRLMPTVHGWQGHLPADATQRRRAFLLAALWVQAPVLGLWLLLWCLALALGEPVQVYKLAVVPVVALGAGYAVLPLERPWSRILGAGALTLSLLPGWWALIAAVPVLLAAERWAGPLKRRHRAAMPRHREAHPGSLPWRIALRAAGSCLLRGYLRASFPVILAWFFLRNNTLTAAQVTLGVRAGCGLGAAFLLLGLAGHLRAYRPPWGWSRSLPWSSRRRVLQDALFLAASGVPVVIAGAWLHPAAALPLAALLAYCSLRLAASLRPTASHLTRLGAWIIVEVIACTLALAVTPWSAWLLVFLLPAAVHAATQRERALKVGLWLEREHVTAGDAVS